MKKFEVALESKRCTKKKKKKQLSRGLPSNKYVANSKLITLFFIIERSSTPTSIKTHLA